ncbi:AI-2E family transporter [Streptomyces sp. NPDC002004]
MGNGSVPPDRPSGRGGAEPGSGRRRRRGASGGRRTRLTGREGRARPAAALRSAVRPDRAVRVHPALRIAAAYAWRLLVVGVAIYEIFTILGRFQLVAVAVFLALVITSVLRPLTDLLDRRLPRSLAVVVALVGSIVLFFGLLALVGNAVAGESDQLAAEFRGGFARIQRWLEGPPFRVNRATLSGLQTEVVHFLTAHRATLISTAVSGFGRVVELVTGIVLAVFASIFFIHSGERLWSWFLGQIPEGARPLWSRGGRAAWTTFAGYTRGIIIVAATNATLVGIALFALGVPLALPLTLLEFFAAFIPLIGSPIALGVATVVALAGRGPVVALAVVLLIVVIGQIEGHVLHPLVMSWAVRLHPVVVAISVIAGSIVAGVIGAVVAVPLVSVVWSVVQATRTAAREQGRTEEGSTG